MSLSTAVRSLPGIRQAAAIMGTERNKATLEASGLLVGEAVGARPDDLVIVVQGDDEQAVAGAVTHLERLLAQEAPRTALGGETEGHPHSLGAALKSHPGANLALISVPGVYAAAEAVKALRSGLHVQVFSDNVTIEEEVALKRLGQELGLLVMGPDCGTSLIGGVPLGFANAVARGPIGLIGASGTGIQEVSVLVHHLGSGISHALGTGGRDLSDAVGGVTTLQALQLLEQDPATRVIVIISKPPGARTAETVLAQAQACRKPVVINFLGWPVPSSGRVTGAATLEEAAAKAVALARGESPEGWREAFSRADSRSLIMAEAAQKTPGQRYLRGLYSGGTLAEEAIYVLEPKLGAIFSNVSLRPEHILQNPRQSHGHCVVDLGDDEFTRGRPHPMIDPSYRAERLVAEAADPEVAVLLLDVVLGFGAHPNPAGVLAEAIRTARALSGRHLTVVASVCGTSADPQDAERQEAILRGEGVIVLPSNACAAEVAGEIARRCVERGVE
ncbi:MAG: acyl-CoA synthetase FdrA [Betaproteobacteria bacterium]